MSTIPNLTNYNKHKQNLVKIQTANEEALLCSKEEIKSILIKHIYDEIDLFGNTNISVFKSKLEERLNFKIKQIEISMVNHINEKIDKVTEKIIDIITNRNLEKETEKRVDVKIKKTRKKDEQV